MYVELELYAQTYSFSFVSPLNLLLLREFFILEFFNVLWREDRDGNLEVTC